jgi:hypothetical protein
MSLTKITDLPFVQLTKEHPHDVWNACTQEGVIARKFKVPLAKCPPFRDSDMTVSWKMGWHRENERIRKGRQDEQA